MSDATIVTAIIAGFFVVLALLAILRVIIRRDAPPYWRRVRLGVFLERDPHDDEADPP